MLNVAMQDVDQLGDVIYRDADTEAKALRQARKDYIGCNFAVIAVYDYDFEQTDFCEVLEFN